MKTSLKTTIQTFCHDLSAKTRITVLCCGCFLVLTGFLLVFLMLCPVKKENLSNHANENLMSAITTSAPTATTTAEETTTFKRTRKTTDKKRARSTTQTTVKTELIETEEPLMTEENSSDDLYSNDYNNNYNYNYGYDNSYNNGYDNSYNNGYDNGYNNGNGSYEPATDAPNRFQIRNLFQARAMQADRILDSKKIIFFKFHLTNCKKTVIIKSVKGSS